MKIINKAYKIQIYPNKGQKVLLEKHFGCVRFVYNHFLGVRNVEYNTNKVNMSYCETANELTVFKSKEEFVWLNDINAQSLQWSLRYLDIAFRNFFRGNAKFPSFKKKSSEQSFKVPVNSTFKLINKKIILPKFREGIDFKGQINLNELVKFNSITITKTSSGKYFASLQGEFKHNPKDKVNKNIGIDLGIKDFLVTSEGTKIVNPKYFEKSSRKLKYKQRQLSKKNKGSKSRDRQRVQVAKVYEKITNKKDDFLHKLSNKIINDNQVICLEDLAVKNMLQNHKLAKNIQSASWSKFITMLKYKAEWNDREVIQIDRFYPSSKSCSSCHYIKEDLALSDREWTCPNCGEKHDRDINAAINILTQGLNKKSCGSGVESQSKQKRVKALPLGKSKKPEAKAI